MYKDNSKDICSGNDKVDITFLSLISNKINVGIIGSGKGGIIKGRYFLKQGCNVHMITKDSFENSKSIKSFSHNNKFKIECREYTKDFILDKHLIIIAVDNYEAKEKIKEDCDKLYKLYVDCTNFRDGLALVPVMKETDNLAIGINTKGGNPKAVVYVGDKIKSELKDYDDFIQYTTFLRNKFKKVPSIKTEALNFILSDDFYFFFKKGKGESIIKLFYDEVQ